MYFYNLVILQALSFAIESHSVNTDRCALKFNQSINLNIALHNAILYSTFYALIKTQICFSGQFSDFIYVCVSRREAFKSPIRDSFLVELLIEGSHIVTLRGINLVTRSWSCDDDNNSHCADGLSTVPTGYD